jgi:hypothetical protein
VIYLVKITNKYWEPRVHVADGNLPLCRNGRGTQAWQEDIGPATCKTCAFILRRREAAELTKNEPPEIPNTRLKGRCLIFVYGYPVRFWAKGYSIVTADKASVFQSGRHADRVARANGLSWGKFEIKPK